MRLQFREVFELDLPPFLLLPLLFRRCFSCGQGDCRLTFLDFLLGPGTNCEWSVDHQHVCKRSMQVEFACELASFSSSSLFSPPQAQPGPGRLTAPFSFPRLPLGSWNKLQVISWPSTCVQVINAGWTCLWTYLLFFSFAFFYPTGSTSAGETAGSLFISTTSSGVLEQIASDQLAINMCASDQCGLNLPVNLPPFLLLLLRFFLLHRLNLGREDCQLPFHFHDFLWGPGTNCKWSVGHQHVCKWSMRVEFACELTSFPSFFSSWPFSPDLLEISSAPRMAFSDLWNL